MALISRDYLEASGSHRSIGREILVWNLSGHSSGRVLHQFREVREFPAVNVLLATAITAAGAALAYHLVEQPMITVGKRVAALFGKKAKPALVDADRGFRIAVCKCGMF